jgi:hypothetical protein
MLFNAYENINTHELCQSSMYEYFNFYTKFGLSCCQIEHTSFSRLLVLQVPNLCLGNFPQIYGLQSSDYFGGKL